MSRTKLYIMCKALCLIILMLCVIVAFGSTLVYARSQYAAGLLAGEALGKQEALISLQAWQYSHSCKTTLDDFVSLKMWRDSENRYQFDCLVK